MVENSREILFVLFISSVILLIGGISKTEGSFISEVNNDIQISAALVFPSTIEQLTEKAQLLESKLLKIIDVNRNYKMEITSASTKDLQLLKKEIEEKKNLTQKILTDVQKIIYEIEEYKNQLQTFEQKNEFHFILVAHEELTKQLFRMEEHTEEINFPELSLLIKKALKQKSENNNTLP